MKKIFLTFSGALIMLMTSAQNSNSRFYFDAGLKGGYGLTMFLNQNIMDDKHVGTNFSYGYTYGGRLGGNFNERHSINIEVLSSAFNQSYSIKTDSLQWKKQISYKSLDVALLYRHFVEGSYMEIDPEMAIIQSATESNSITGSRDNSKDFVANYFAGAFGFGGNFLGGENVSLMAGFRATYSFTDVISDMGGKSQISSYPFNEIFYKSNYKTYKSTHPLTVRFVMELAFDLGYFTRSTCNKKRTKFLTF